MHPFRRGLAAMFRGARVHPRATLLAMVTGLVNGVSMVAGAKALGWATDVFVVPSFASGELLVGAGVAASGAVLGVCLVRVVTIVLRGVATSRIQFGAQASSRRALTRQYLALDVAWHRRHPPGRLVSTVLSDVEVAWLPMTWFPFAIGMVGMLLVALGSVLVADPVLAAVAAVLVPVVLGANLLNQRLVPPRARRAQQARAELSQRAHEAFEGHEVLRTLGAVDTAVVAFAAETEQLRRANVRTAYVAAAFDPVVELAPTAAVLAVLAVGAERYASGDITVGVLVQVVYLLLTSAIPLAVIGRLLGVLPAAVVGHERVDAVLDADEYPRRGSSVPGPGAVGVELLGAGLPPALHDVDLLVEPGAVVGVAGATGAGKSTLLSLAAGMLDPETGQVRLGGVAVPELAEGELTRGVALVPQQAFLFDDTVRANLMIGVVAGADEELWHALHVADADGFVRNLPDGLDTPLGEAGASLSGGQRQRLAIARAVVRRPRLLLLDDATSALDPAVERTVLHRLAEEVGRTGATLLLTATRRASTSLTDRVVHLVAGRVEAVGTDADLRADPGYRALVDAYDEAALLEAGS